MPISVVMMNPPGSLPGHEKLRDNADDETDDDGHDETHTTSMAGVRSALSVAGSEVRPERDRPVALQRHVHLPRLVAGESDGPAALRPATVPLVEW